MRHELALQVNMFTGDKVDTRSAVQKKADERPYQAHQIEMFRQREIAQFGVNARPLLPLSPFTKLTLISEDPRTDEEKARDLQREAEAQTFALFPEIDLSDQPARIATDNDQSTLYVLPLPHTPHNIYFALVETIAEMAILNVMEMTGAIISAYQQGLTADLVTTAVQLGDQRRTLKHTPPVDDPVQEVYHLNQTSKVMREQSHYSCIPMLI